MYETRLPIKSLQPAQSLDCPFRFTSRNGLNSGVRNFSFSGAGSKKPTLSPRLKVISFFLSRLTRIRLRFLENDRFIGKGRSLCAIAFVSLLLGSCGNGGGDSTAGDDGADNGETTALNLVEHQWHLRNTGQTAFSQNPGVAGEDINLDLATRYKGNGVKVAVVDTGLEIGHEDLKPNVLENGSWDFQGRDTNPTSTRLTGDHGTAIAGLIAMRDDNFLPTLDASGDPVVDASGDPVVDASKERGGRGVAPRVSLVGYNYLRNATIANHIASLGGSAASPKSNDVDVFNMSYGKMNRNSLLIDSLLFNHFENALRTFRGGKGPIYVKSAGNGFDFLFFCNHYRFRLNVRVSCQNANMDPNNAYPWIIVVGATNASAVKASYSNAGANLWVSAPGGENGSTHPALITTDSSGCEKGYSRGVATRNGFENNGNGENPNCNYTSRSNGTSSAAPVVAGVVALMLEANPDLTLRDVRKILADTARQIDADIEPVEATVDSKPYTLEQGWITNAAGYTFHNWYGFGRVDANEAVRASETLTSHRAMADLQRCDWNDSGALSKTIPDASADGTGDAISVGNRLDFIEAVQVSISIADHFLIGDLSIELVAPSGTKSILLNGGNLFASRNLDRTKFSSNAFFGESSLGSWSLKIVDVHEDSESPDPVGSLTNWKIKFEGQGNCG